MSDKGCGCDGPKLQGPVSSLSTGPARARTLRVSRDALPERIDSREDLDKALAVLEARRRRIVAGFELRRAMRAKGGSRSRQPAPLSTTSTSYCKVYASAFPGTAPSNWYKAGIIPINTSDFTVNRRPGPTISNSAVFDPVDSLMMATMTAWRIPSASIAILGPLHRKHSGDINLSPMLIYEAGFTYHPAFRARDFPNEDPLRDPDQSAVQPSTRFRLASVSKLLTATAAMAANNVLIADRWPLLDLEENLPTYLPDDLHYLEDPTFRRMVKVKHLLSHSSGLPRDPPSDSDVARFDNVMLPTTLDRVLRCAGATYICSDPYWAADCAGVTNPHDCDFPFAPGTDARYSNYGYQLMGAVLGEIGNAVGYDDYAGMVKALVTKPLSMHGTVVRPFAGSLGNEVRYYDNRSIGSCGCDDDCESTTDTMKSVLWSGWHEGDPLGLRVCDRAPYGGKNPLVNQASGGWVSSARDLMRLARETILGYSGLSTLLMDQTRWQQMLTVQASGDRDYGYGWEAEVGGNWKKKGTMCGSSTWIWIRGEHSAMVGSPKRPGQALGPAYAYLFNVDLDNAITGDFHTAMTEILRRIDFANFGSSDDLF